MLLRYESLAPDSAAFRDLAGISVRSFNALVKRLEAGHVDARTESHTKKGTARVRRPGAGRKFSLSFKDRLLVTLIRLRTNSTYDLLGRLFGIDKANIYRNIKYMMADMTEKDDMPRIACKSPGKKVRNAGQLADTVPKAAAVLSG